MRITFRYMAQLRQAAGVTEESIDVEAPASAAALLSRLADRHDDAFRRILFDERGQLHGSNLVFLREQQIAAAEEQQFRDGDVLTVLTPMAGG